MYCTTGRMDGAVKVVARVAVEVDVSDAWVNASIDWILSVLRKSEKAGKVEAFECLDNLLHKYDPYYLPHSQRLISIHRCKSDLPKDLILIIVEQMKLYVSTQDISLLASALSILACLMQISPPRTYPAVEAEYLSEIYSIAHSPLVTGASLDALLAFFAALVEADSQIATHVIPNLTIPLQKATKNDGSYGYVAKAIGTVVRCHTSLAAGTIAEFSKASKVSIHCVFTQSFVLKLRMQKGSKASNHQVVLNLLVLVVLGEIGRTM